MRGLSPNSAKVRCERRRMACSSRISAMIAMKEKAKMREKKYNHEKRLKNLPFKHNLKQSVARSPYLVRQYHAWHPDQLNLRRMFNV